MVTSKLADDNVKKTILVMNINLSLETKESKT